MSDPEQIDILEAITLRFVDITLKDSYSKHTKPGELLSQQKKNQIIFTVYDTKKIDQQKSDAQKLLLNFLSQASNEPLIVALSNISTDLSVLKDIIKKSNDNKKITLKDLKKSTIEHFVGAFFTALFFILLATLIKSEFVRDLIPVIYKTIDDLTKILRDFL